ncbi:MAG: hypothetical protein EBZ74_08205 [Planctomycetia bacterium]|nr:hypothetical protein [Planctomycetia bacterium]
MVDDKDDSAPDPWAGIDDPQGEPAADGFTFSFDASGDVDDGPAVGPFASGVTGGDSDVDVSAWLDEPDALPGGDIAPEAAEDAPAPFPEALPDFGGLAADDVHEAAGTADPAAGSSHVQVGTGFSGIVSPSEIDPAGDDVAEDWDATDAPDNALDDFSSDEQPSFDASGFDGASESGAVPANPDAAGALLTVAGAAAAVAAPAASARVKPPRGKGGGLGQLVGIVLGGLMAIPITYAILIWGFQKDPFKLTRMLPEQVAFLLPQKFQPGGARSPSGPTVAAASPLDNLPVPAGESPAAETAAEPAEEPVVENDKPAGEPVVAPVAEGTEAPAPMPVSPPRPADDLFAEPAPPAPAPPPPPEPEPLDLAALEAAVAEAAAALEAVAAAEPEAPERRRLLVAWYKKLAAAAEQLVLVEKIATDSGRNFAEAATRLDGLCATINAEGELRAELTRLGGMWLSARKRAADGTVLLATFDGTRQVGPYWSTRITVEAAEPRTVSVISRVEPRAEPGDRVLVLGVLFDGDVVWASECRRLVTKPAPVEDLF